MTRRNQPPFQGVVALSTVLREAHKRAQRTTFAERAALYVVRLTESAGFAFATAVQRATRGPDPGVLRERSRAAGVDEPVITGAASVDAVASALERLAALEEPERWLLAAALRDIHRGGQVPILLMLGGTAVVSTLPALAAAEAADFPDFGGWSKSIGDA